VSILILLLGHLMSTPCCVIEPLFYVSILINSIIGVENTINQRFAA